PQHRASGFLYGDDTGGLCHTQSARVVWGYGLHAGVNCLTQGARGLWCLGYPDQGLARSQEAVTLAQQSGHPISLCHTLSAAAMFHQLRREARCTHERAEAATLLAQEQGFSYWMAGGALLHGWTLVHQGQAQAGIAQMHQGLVAHRATGAE